MLESLGTTNIGNLNLDEPRRWEDGEGGLNRVLSRVREPDWNEIKTSVVDHDLELWWCAKIINPEAVHFTDKDWEIARDSLAHFKKDKEWYRYAGFASFTKLLFPEKKDELADSEAWDQMLTHVNNFQQIAAQTNVMLEPGLQMVYNMYLLSPSRKADLHLAENRAHFIQSIIEEVKINPNINPGFWQQAFRIVYPKDGRNVPLSGQSLRESCKRLEQLRQRKRWGVFLRAAAYLQILTAEEVNLTEDGLEIIYKKPEPDFNQVIPSLPETRKF